MRAMWNLFLKNGDDRVSAVALMDAIGAVIYFPWVFAVYGLPNGVQDHVAASALIRTAYFLALVNAYRKVDFSVAYAIARGGAPALVASEMGRSRRSHRNGELSAIGLIVAIIDRARLADRRSPWSALGALDRAADRQLHGQRRSGRPRIRTGTDLHLTVTAASTALLLPIAMWRRGGGALVAAAPARARLWQRLVAGALDIGAYGLFLAAANPLHSAARTAVCGTRTSSAVCLR